MNFDAVVIGAGAVGGATAFQMAEAGLKVALVDRYFPAAGTSRATKAGLGVYPKKSGPNLVINMKGAELYPGLVARLDREVELEMSGVMNVAMSEDEMEKMRAFVAKQYQTPGFQAELLSGREARERMPALSSVVVGAAFCPLDGQINPMLYCDALARGVVRLGGTVMPDTEVLRIEARGAHGWSVATSQGTLESRWVANCAGVWAPHIGRMVGVEIPIAANKGHVLITEPIPPLIRGRISGPTLIRQTSSGNMMLGQSEEMSGYDKIESLVQLTAQAKIARTLLPSLKKVKVIRSFTGLRPWPPDGLPIIGEMPGLPGFLVAVGHSGVSWSPAAGQLLTAVTTDGRPCIPMEPYSITRFQKERTGNRE